MPILIEIAIENDHITDTLKLDNITRKEVAYAVYKLKQIELDLISLEFKDDLYIETHKD